MAYLLKGRREVELQQRMHSDPETMRIFYFRSSTPLLHTPQRSRQYTQQWVFFFFFEFSCVTPKKNAKLKIRNQQPKNRAKSNI